MPDTGCHQRPHFGGHSGGHGGHGATDANSHIVCELHLQICPFLYRTLVDICPHWWPKYPVQR